MDAWRGPSLAGALLGQPPSWSDPDLQALYNFDAGVKSDKAKAEGDERNAAAADYLVNQSWPSQLVQSLIGAATLPGDVYAGKVDPNSREMIQRTTDLAGALTLGPAALPSAANELRMGIKAYHGSPHDFDKFDMSKIGTGEGAQAYGHGLYFAEKEAVAKEYRDSLTKMRVSAAKRMLEQSGDDVDTAIAKVRAEIDRLKNLPNAGNDPVKRDRFIALNEEKLAELSAYKNSGQMSQGRMYEVDINANPEDFLDWDKPLFQQPPGVRSKLETALGPIPADGVMSTPWNTTVPGALQKPDVLNPEYYRTPAKDYAPVGGKAEDRFRDAGIPGIRYLDQGSRAAQAVNDLRGTVSMWERAARKTPDDQYAQQMLAKAKADLAEAESGLTSNYVVFDDKIVSIVKKYGIPGLIAAGYGADVAKQVAQQYGLPEGTEVY